MAIEPEARETREEKIERVEKEEKVESTKEHKQGISKIAQIVWFITGLVAAVLLLRVVLAMAGANLANQFASLVYSITDPLVSPFRGLLQVGEFQAGVARFELETVIAALVYLLIGWAIVSAVRLGK